jgi:hypothetical protein
MAGPAVGSTRSRLTLVVLSGYLVRFAGERMRRFVEDTDRGQSTLFPECLGDWISEDNPVRVSCAQRVWTGYGRDTRLGADVPQVDAHVNQP